MAIATVDSWIKKPNKFFGGVSALDVMLEGDIERIRGVS
ncbi:DUF2384 domain-containing protein [Marinobacter sp. LV10R510-11A]|nr:DUF2384 domain-containing protein [Marinobacter sp. LV10R510-11A]